MKPYLLICMILMSSFTKFNTAPVDYLGVKGPLTFNKTTFNLAWTSKPNDSYYVQEYIPASENVEHFNQMLSIFLLVGDIKTEDAVKQKINELTERKKTDATCNYAVNKSGDGKEYMIDFILGENQNNKTAIQEFNIYQYKQVNVNNKNALLLYAYSKRAYGENINSFLKNLKTNRGDLLNKMSAANIPSLSLK